MDDILDRDVHPERIFLFTTITLLGLLTLSKRGSVDGTFKAMTKHWTQLFVIMVEFKGINIPIALAWLPDKSALSYYTCLYMLVSSFRKHSTEITALYGQSTWRLKKIRCDFEQSIHLGWGVFHLSGCFFHFSQVRNTKLQIKETEFYFLGYLEESAGTRNGSGTQ